MAARFPSTPLVGPMLAMPGATDSFLERIPLRRAAQPEDIAAAALFLAGDDGAYVTGTELVVDGGWERTPTRTCAGCSAEPRA